MNMTRVKRNSKVPFPRSRAIGDDGVRRSKADVVKGKLSSHRPSSGNSRHVMNYSRSHAATSLNHNNGGDDDTTLSMSSPVSDDDYQKNCSEASFSSSDGSSYYSDDLEKDEHDNGDDVKSLKNQTKMSELIHKESLTLHSSRMKDLSVVVDDDNNDEEVCDSTARLAKAIEELSDSLRSDRIIDISTADVQESNPKQQKQKNGGKSKEPATKSSLSPKTIPQTTSLLAKGHVSFHDMSPFPPPAPFPAAQPLMDMVDSYYEVDIASTNSGVSDIRFLMTEDTHEVFCRRMIPLEVNTASHSHKYKGDHNKNNGNYNIDVDDDISAVSETVDGSVIGYRSCQDEVGSSEFAVHIHMEKAKNINVGNEEGLDEHGNSGSKKRDNLVPLFVNGIVLKRQMTLSTMHSLSSWEDQIEDDVFSEAANSNEAIKAPSKKAQALETSEKHPQEPDVKQNKYLSPISHHKNFEGNQGQPLTADDDDWTEDSMMDKRIERLKNKIRKIQNHSHLVDDNGGSRRPSAQSSQVDSGQTSSLSTSLGDGSTKVSHAEKSPGSTEPSKAVKVQNESVQRPQRPQRSEFLQVPKEIPLKDMEEVSLMECDIRLTSNHDVRNMKRPLSYDVEAAAFEDVEIESLTPHNHEDRTFSERKKQFNDFFSQLQNDMKNSLGIGQRSISHAASAVSEHVQGWVVNIRQRSLKDQILLATIAVGSFILFILLIMVAAK